MSASKVAIPAKTMIIQVYVYYKYNVAILQHHSDTFDEVCDTNMDVLPTNAAFPALSEPPVYNYEY